MFHSLLAAAAVAGTMIWGSIMHPGQPPHPPMSPHSTSTPPAWMASSTNDRDLPPDMEHMPTRDTWMASSTRPDWQESTSTRADWHDASSTRPMPPPPRKGTGSSTPPMMHDGGDMHMSTDTDMTMGSSSDHKGPPPVPSGFFKRLFHFF